MTASQRNNFVPFTLDDVVEAYKRRQSEFKKESDPHRRKILLNFNLHAALELSGRFEEILDPELTVDQPMYEYFQSGVSYHGARAVHGFYASLVENNATAIISDSQKVAVADWGFCAEQVSNYYVPAQMARNYGIPAVDGRYYVLHRPLVMIWYYDDAAKLVGERIYHAANLTYSEVPEEQYIRTELLAQALAPFIETARKDLRALS